MTRFVSARHLEGGFSFGHRVQTIPPRSGPWMSLRAGQGITGTVLRPVLLSLRWLYHGAASSKSMISCARPA